jgi:hypothetical protein
MTMLADPACPTCILFEDGDPPCPDHGGTYEPGDESLRCPACGSDCVVVCQKGAACVCMACEDEPGR